jgi:hypothetical protein
MLRRIWFLCPFLCLLTSVLRATQEADPIPAGPPPQTREVPGLDGHPPPAPQPPKAVGPIVPAAGQPVGAMSGRVVFTSAGHGWAWNGSGWGLGRGVLNELNEDYGNLDQMSLFAYYCFNAGATVVAHRPIGNQVNEVVLDNGSPGVTFSAGWANSSSDIYFGQPGEAVPYRFASAAGAESAVATYVPTLPAAGFYPVYTWVLHGANRTNQLYRIRHTGGESQVRVPHHRVGNGWVYLGSYHFNAGSNAVSGAVLISNFVPGAGTSVVIADAIRFGNGLGSLNRGGGVSTYPREDECARYWVQNGLGVGQSTGLYDVAGSGDDSDNVGTPPRMSAEMNREAGGGFFQRVLVSFHSNASGSANPTARGVIGLYNDPTLSSDVAPNSGTPNQRQLAQLLAKEVNDDLVSLSGRLELPWQNRTSLTYARSDFAFGEINNNALDGEMDATIVEVAFHDEPNDARLLRDPKVRDWVARATYQGLLRYFNQFDAAPLAFLPEPPGNVRAYATSGGIVVAWTPPVAQGGSGVAAGYVVYRSTDGYGFGEPVGVSGVVNTQVLLTNLTTDTAWYLRVAATNAGGESLPSATVGCRRAANPALRRTLVVNAFDRFDRTLNLRQTPAARNYRPPGHDRNTGTMERVLPRRNNAFDYLVAHGQALAAAGAPFDSRQNELVAAGQAALGAYANLIWCAGNESTADETFSSAEQAQVAAFAAAGGNLFVSGSEIGWDLDRNSGPTAADRTFLRTTLRATLNGNTNDSSGIYNFAPVTGSLFAGNPTGAFDDGSQGIYWVGYPDVLTPHGSGASTAATYPGLGRGAAAVQYDGSAGGGKVVLLGFPFESITSASVREAILADALRFFRLPVRFTGIEWLPAGQPRLTFTGEPGVTYTLHGSTNLTAWSALGSVVNASGSATFTDTTAAGQARRFYRAVAVP